MKRIAFILICGPLILFGQNKLFLENQSTGRTIKIKKRHNVVCTTLADKSFSGNLKNYSSTSMTLKILRTLDNNKNGYTDTVISFVDITKLSYTRHAESDFRTDLLFYGTILGSLSLIGGTAVALNNDGQGGRQTGFVFIGAGLLLLGGVMHGLITTGATEYDLISDWKIMTK